MAMKLRPRSGSGLLGALGALAGIRPRDTRTPYGRYGDGRWGIFVFRDDGMFGYDLVTKCSLFFNEDHLPPKRGRWKAGGDGGIEIEFDEAPWGVFRIEWNPAEGFFDLVFEVPPEGDFFPPVIRFTKCKRRSFGTWLYLGFSGYGWGWSR